MHEAVANHFSLAVNPEGTQFLMNPNMWHFSRIKASDLLLLNVDDTDCPKVSDPTKPENESVVVAVASPL